MQPGQYDSFRKRPKDDLLASRSLERGRSGFEKRRSWSPDDYGNSLSNFRPVTLTVSSGFKQVCGSSDMLENAGHQVMCVFD